MIKKKISLIIVASMITTTSFSTIAKADVLNHENINLTQKDNIVEENEFSKAINYIGTSNININEDENNFKVTNENELREALENEKATTIQLSNDIKVKSDITVARGNFTIEGNGHTLTLPTSQTNPSNVHFTGDNVKINNIKLAHEGNASVKSCIITVSGDNFTIENSKILNAGNYGIQFYKAHNALVNKVTIDGAKNGGLLVNASEVTIKDVTLSNNRVMGIEICYGKGINTAAHKAILNVKGSLNIVGTLLQVKAETGKGATVNCDGNQLVSKGEVFGLTTYGVSIIAGEGFGPEGDVTPSLEDSVNDGSRDDNFLVELPVGKDFGPEGDVTPDLEAPAGDGSEKDSIEVNTEDTNNKNETTTEGGTSSKLEEDYIQKNIEDTTTLDENEELQDELFAINEEVKENKEAVKRSGENIKDSSSKGGMSTAAKATAAVAVGGTATGAGIAIFRKRKLK